MVTVFLCTWWDKGGHADLTSPHFPFRKAHKNPTADNSARMIMLKRNTKNINGFLLFLRVVTFEGLWGGTKIGSTNEEPVSLLTSCFLEL